MSDTSQGPGWWQASDGKWYPPEQQPASAPGPSSSGSRLDLGAALSYGWTKFVENLSTMILIVLIFFGVQIVVNFATQLIYSQISSLILAFFVLGIVVAVTVFISFMLEAGLIRASLAVTEGRPPEASMMFSTERIAPFAIGAIIVGLLSFVGILVCCIGYVVVRLFMLFWGFYVLDRQTQNEPVDAIKNSFNLVKNNAGDVLVFAIVIVIINLFTCGLAIGVTEISTGYAYKKLTGQAIAD